MIRSTDRSSFPDPTASAVAPPTETTLAELGWPEWQKRWWLERTSKALRGGVGLRPTEDLSGYFSKSREQIITQWLGEPRFADTVLDFNLFFLGFRQDRIRKDGGFYADAAFELPQAVISAQEVLRGGPGWSKLLELDQQQGPFIKPLGAPYNNRPLPGDESLASEDLRKALLGRIRVSLQTMIDQVTANPQIRLAEFCPGFETEADVLHDLGQLGFSTAFYRTNVLFADDWYNKLRKPCGDSANPIYAGFDILGTLQLIQRKNEMLFAMIPGLLPAAYPNTDVSSIRTFSLTDFDLHYRSTFFTFPLYRALPNSSTNGNRKRAAYILKRFFCDDLTPINVEVPAAHAQGAHGSDPSCYACHYKLDPMAGFFRTYGSRFRDFSTRTNVVFDDGAFIKRVEYEAAWKNPAGSARDWNIGYIRSTRREDLNSYGASLEDLFGLIQSAPEVRRCVVKRLFEYLVSPDQVIDAGYLEETSQAFNQAWNDQGSTEALKQVVTKITLSNTFSTPRTHADECYDHPSSGGTNGGPPCRVAFIIQKNCATCHSAQGASGGLDLTSWKQDAGGRWGFVLQSSDGTTRESGAAFQDIVDRLGAGTVRDPSGNPRPPMPLGAEMPAADREALYLWADQEARHP